jgi:hypothetical protein
LKSPSDTALVMLTSLQSPTEGPFDDDYRPESSEG